MQKSYARLFVVERYNVLQSCCEHKVSSEHQKLARAALSKLQSVRIFGSTRGEDSLTAILLDTLLYDSASLGFKAFNTLLYFISQSFVFTTTLEHVVT
eukprot:COSAG05_NODE_8279_length_719_cov_0.700000_2_plen_97_part_01